MSTPPPSTLPAAVSALIAQLQQQLKAKDEEFESQTRELDYARLKIRVLEERLRRDRIARYGVRTPWAHRSQRNTCSRAHSSQSPLSADSGIIPLPASITYQLFSRTAASTIQLPGQGYVNVLPLCIPEIVILPLSAGVSTNMSELADPDFLFFSTSVGTLLTIAIVDVSTVAPHRTDPYQSVPPYHA